MKHLPQWFYLAGSVLFMIGTVLSMTGCADTGVLRTNRCDDGGKPIYVDGTISACRYDD